MTLFHISLLSPILSSPTQADFNDANLILGDDGRLGVIDFGDIVHRYVGRPALKYCRKENLLVCCYFFSSETFSIFEAISSLTIN